MRSANDMLPEMATIYHGGGSQSPTSLSKPIERVFEDAQHTGEIHLSCRKLRAYPKLAAKYDLVDTISADISKNRLSEVPKEVCTYISMEKLDCYHNVVKSIPEALVQLQALTYLSLSRNQLSVIPSFISQLQALEVLIASHNRLVSLPEEIGVLDKLMELDVSCNEISHLPMQIGDLKSLKSLNVRRNLLQELPIEISKLNLRKLDISSNRVSKIPTVFRRIETLEEIILENNPLTTPPAHVCTKGKQHIMKYLHIIAIREDKARQGMLGEVELKRFRKSLPPAQSVSSEEFRNLMESPDKWKRHTVLSSDSGYSTTDSVDKCGWSPQEGTVEPQHLIDSSNLAVRAAQAICREQRIYPPPREPRREPPEPPQRVNSRLSSENLERPSPPQTLTPGSSSSKSQFSSPPTPPTLYPSNPQTPLTPPTPQGPGPGAAGDAQSILGTSLADEFTRELQRQKQDYETRKKIAEQLRIQQEEEEEREQRRRAAQRIQDEQRALLDKQREEAEEAKRRDEEHRLVEEARKAAEDEARKVEEARQKEEARRQEELRRQEEARQHKAENNFYFKTNSTNNYSNSNHAWPPPPSPLANQHEAQNSPLPSQSAVRSPVSPDQHFANRTNFINYSHAQSGYSDHNKATSPGYSGPGHTYRTSGQQSPGYPGHSPSFQTQSGSGHVPSPSAHIHSNSGHGQNYSGYGTSSGQQRQSPGQFHRSPSGQQYSPVSSPQGPVYHGNSHDLQRQNSDGSQHSQGYRTTSHEHVRQSSDSQYINSYSHSAGPNTNQYGHTGQQFVSNVPHSQQNVNYNRYQNVLHESSSPNEISSQNTSVLHTAYRDHQNHHVPMSPVREQAEPRDFDHHGNIGHDHYGNPENNRYGNLHDSTNSMPVDSYPHHRKPTVSASNSFKEERRPGDGNQQYRRTVSDSNQRLPAGSHPIQTQHGQPLTNGPIEEQVSVNGTTPGHQPGGESPDTSFNSTQSHPPHVAPAVNGPKEDSHKMGPGVARRTKPTDRGQAPVSKVTKPTSRAPGTTTSTRSALPTSKRSNLNQDEEMRKSNQSLKSVGTNKPKGDQRLRSIQKDSVNNYMNRRSSGSTSSEDDRKRSTPTRSLALQNSSSAPPTSKRSGTGMSGTKRTTTTGAARTHPTSRVTHTTPQTSARSRQNSTSSTTSVSSTTTKSKVDKTKRSGAVMTSAQVKMLDDYSKEANGPNYTMRRQHDHHKESVHQIEQLRKTISTRLKRALPENLSEALSDGVLLCHLANQIRPRSVASVHVPSPAVPKLTPPKCRKNVENFLEACRKIGVSKDQICESSDILAEKGITRVANTVAALVAIATHSKQPVPSNV